MVVEDVGEVETESSTATDADIGDEGRVRPVCTVDVNDCRTLTHTRWRVTPYHHVTYRHLAKHTRTSTDVTRTAAVAEAADHTALKIFIG